MSTAAADFVYPVRVLESERVKLVPYENTLHAKPLFEALLKNPELLHYIPFVPPNTLEELEELCDALIKGDVKIVLWAVYNKAQNTDEEDDFAGIIGLLNTFPEHATTEIGFVMTLTKYHRTHVTTNSVGLLLLYTLDHPPHGLGLRRVQWQANALNQPSINTAKRMGMTFEGIQRWQRALPHGKEGNGIDTSALPEATGKALGPGRDTAILAMYWDEWEEKRPEVVKLMNRAS